MKRVIFLNRFFFPDHSATSQILCDVALYLSGCGHDVKVITSRQLYDEPDALLPEIQTICGIAVHRVATTRFGRTVLLGRGLDYFSCYALMWRSVLLLAKPGDIVVAKTDPPLLGVVAMHAAKRRGLRLVNWLHDLYPEIVSQLGVPFIKDPLGRGLLHLRDASLQAASANVWSAIAWQSVSTRAASPTASLSSRTGAMMKTFGRQRVARIRCAANGGSKVASLWGIREISARRLSSTRFLLPRSAYGTSSKSYSCLSVVVVKFSELARLVKERSLDNLFGFFPYQDRAVLTHSIGVADVHWVSLKPDLEGLIVPSKFYGIAAAGRPIIAVTQRTAKLLVSCNDTIAG